MKQTQINEAKFSKYAKMNQFSETLPSLEVTQNGVYSTVRIN